MSGREFHLRGGRCPRGGAAFEQSEDVRRPSWRRRGVHQNDGGGRADGSAARHAHGARDAGVSGLVEIGLRLKTFRFSSENDRDATARALQDERARIAASPPPGRAGPRRSPRPHRARSEVSRRADGSHASDFRRRRYRFGSHSSPATYRRGARRVVREERVRDAFLDMAGVKRVRDDAARPLTTLAGSAGECGSSTSWRL